MNQFLFTLLITVVTLHFAEPAGKKCRFEIEINGTIEQVYPEVDDTICAEKCTHAIWEMSEFTCDGELKCCQQSENVVTKLVNYFRCKFYKETFHQKHTHKGSRTCPKCFSTYFGEKTYYYHNCSFGLGLTMKGRSALLEATGTKYRIYGLPLIEPTGVKSCGSGAGTRLKTSQKFKNIDFTNNRHFERVCTFLIEMIYKKNSFAWRQFQSHRSAVIVNGYQNSNGLLILRFSDLTFDNIDFCYNLSLLLKSTAASLKCAGF